MLLDRASLMGPAHRSHQAPRFTVRAARVVVDTRETEAVDKCAGTEVRPEEPAPKPHRVFPDLITEEAELGEDQVYGAAAELVVDWRQAWLERRSARHTLAWLQAERRRLELELRLVAVFGLTPPPTDAPWRERRREQELDWRRRVLRRLRWLLPLTWSLHGLLRLLTLGPWAAIGDHPTHTPSGAGVRLVRTATTRANGSARPSCSG